MLNSRSSAVYVTDSAQRVIDANRAFIALLGKPEEKIRECIPPQAFCGLTVSCKCFREIME
ncbi:MAG: PAS domain-containing protein [Spirochaetales bacterium]|nr:PAS domain-containing protein [Spirochaetales bacterium]